MKNQFLTLALFLSGMLIISACESNYQKPVVYLIGDSTVKNGSGKGADGMWGWGDMISEYFDTSKVEIQNHAIGGRNTRTFRYRDRWVNILNGMNEGDYVLMQFGHNDGAPVISRAYGSIRGNGPDTMYVEHDSTFFLKDEIVHSYGWYIRQYIKETREKGATPIVLSMIPRNIWEGDSVLRANMSYGKWAKEAAEQEDAFFIDLNEITAKKYELLGPDKVKEMYFPGDHTHTNREGAIDNAQSVVHGILMCGRCDLDEYLNDIGESL